MTEISNDFVHLHCHSEFSLLDGANRLNHLIARAAELEMPAQIDLKKSKAIEPF